jgi:cell wall assembly regulator SMI1
LLSLSSGSSFPLPEDFRASYALHNGQHDSSSTGVIIGLKLLPLDWILGRMEELERQATELPAWIKGQVDRQLPAARQAGTTPPFDSRAGATGMSRSPGGPL